MALNGFMTLRAFSKAKSKGAAQLDLRQKFSWPSCYWNFIFSNAQKSNKSLLLLPVKIYPGCLFQAISYPRKRILCHLADFSASQWPPPWSWAFRLPPWSATSWCRCPRWGSPTRRSALGRNHSSCRPGTGSSRVFRPNKKDIICWSVWQFDSAVSGQLIACTADRILLLHYWRKLIIFG